MFWKNKILFVLVLFVSIFWYVVFSDAVNTSYTEFYFVSGANHYTTMSVNLTWWETGNVEFYLENKSNADIAMNLSFVDSEVIDFNWTWVRVCKSENEKDEFGNYIDIGNDTFDLLAGNGFTGSLDLLFPAWYSWVYLGCMVYYPYVTGGNDHLNTVARKAIFLDVDVNSTYKNMNIIVRPAFRSDWWDSYGFSWADFWLFSYEGGVWNEMYNSAKSNDDKITIAGNWIGVVSLLSPTSWSEYLVAFKWSWSLSIWYTGIWNDDISWFNMFSWDIADSLSNEFVIKYYNWGYTWNYLKMWDVAAENSWNYDFIKDPDFALMTYNLTTIANPSHPDRFDLDWNDIINALEQTMITDTYNHVWFISLQNEIPLLDFVDI